MKKSLRRTFLILLVPMALVAGAAGGYMYYAYSNPEGQFRVSDRLAGARTVSKLDGAFKDEDGDLVADPPPSDQLLDPDTLVFTVLESSPERADKRWSDFVRHLEKQTGKKVLLREKVAYPPEDIAEFKAGKYHIAALATGAVPTMVNSAGFVPDCAMADAEGKYGYKMEIIVPSDSPVKELKDLKGKRVALTSFSSLSSFKAPVTLLARQGLILGDHYDYRQVGLDHAIRSVANHEPGYDATAVPSDYLQRKVAEWKLDTGKYRSIHTSDVYPPACFGHHHALKPELARKVREAFIGYDWKGTALETEYAPANQTRFVPVDYRKDWEPVRKIDEELNHLIDR